MDIQISNQPSQSPDLNVLDLGYFNSIQSLQQRIRCETVDDLIEAVEKSFVDLDRKNLRNIFVMWQLVMLKVIEVEGDNTYKMPRKTLHSLEDDGLVKTTVVVSDEMVERILVGGQKKINNWTLPKGNPLMTRSKTKCLIRIDKSS